MVEIMKKRHLGRIAMLATLLLSGCAINQPAIVHQPMAVRPPPPQLANPDNGAIYDVATYRPLFEDYKARLIGDLLTVELTERNSASKSSESSVARENDIGFSVPTVSGVAGKSFQGAELEAESDNQFDASGSASNENDFSGTVTVTVVDVYPNGHLLVSGEKQIAMSRGTEFIRFSGVVDPVNISRENSVLSTQVADARIEFRANGYIDEAQTMPWLSRFFMNVLPY